MSNNFKNEYWTVTAGDLSSKRYRIEAPEYSNTPTNDVYKIVVDQSVKYQDWIGVGAAITDASAKLIWNQTANQRHDLLEELFSPEKGNFSVIRIPIGACDFSSQNYYSYDDLPFGSNDHDLKYFSIGEGKPGTSNAAMWPAMIWTFKELAEFGYHYLRPALDKTFPETKLFYWDGSLNTLDKPLSNYITQTQASAFDGFAFHTYDAPYTNLFNASREFPNWKLVMTERRCLFKDTIEDASHIMMGLIGNWLVRQGLSSITLWNLALDERGLPNAAGSTGRRGVITIDHQTGKVQRNLEYYMLRNLSQDVPNGKLIKSSSYSATGYTGYLTSTAFLEDDNSIAVQIYNPTGNPLKAALNIVGHSHMWQIFSVPAWGTVTVHKSNFSMNESNPRTDEEFELHPTKLNLSDDVAPGKETK